MSRSRIGERSGCVGWQGPPELRPEGSKNSYAPTFTAFADLVTYGILPQQALQDIPEDEQGDKRSLVPTRDQLTGPSGRCHRGKAVVLGAHAAEQCLRAEEQGPEPSSVQQRRTAGRAPTTPGPVIGCASSPLHFRDWIFRFLRRLPPREFECRSLQDDPPELPLPLGLPDATGPNPRPALCRLYRHPVQERGFAVEMGTSLPYPDRRRCQSAASIPATESPPTRNRAKWGIRRERRMVGHGHSPRPSTCRGA